MPTLKKISVLPQDQIDQLKAYVEEDVSEAYDLVYAGMVTAAYRFAEEHGYEPDDILDVLNVENFTVTGDKH